MVSRRVFLKNGAFALVSLGFAPSFLARTAFAAAPSRPPAAADRDLPARRRRRPEHGRAVRRRRLLPRAAEHRDRASRPATTRRIDLDGFFGLNPRLATAQAVLGSAASWPSFTRAARPTRRARTSTRRTTWKAATPGVKSTGDGWLNRYLQARRVENASSFRAVALTPAAAAGAAGRGAGAGDEPDRRSSASAATGSARRSRRSTPRPPIGC